MEFEYYHNNDGDQFRYIQLPTILLEHEKFSGLSLESIVLYSMMLNRISLSFRNGWIDEHSTLFNRIYDESRQIHRYIGEWHTHPEKIPNYSGMDLKNWERIAKDLKNVEYFYHVIIGIDAYRIWQYDKDGKITLINTFYWKEHKLDEKNN